MSLEPLLSLADSLFNKMPPWITAGSLGNDDTRYLMTAAYCARADVAVEIGTASGFSTLALCHALDRAHAAGLIGDDFRVISYDILTAFYGDPSKRVGDAVREQLPASLLKHVIFRNPATADDLGSFHPRNGIRFLFLDADHRHPAPTLDLLKALPYLAPGATVVLHDINLPVLHPSCQDWGVKHLFDGLTLPKVAASEDYVSNIGSFIVPEDKPELENQLRRILDAYEWQMEPTLTDRR